MLTDFAIKRKVELKVSACKLRDAGQNIFSDIYAVIG